MSSNYNKNHTESEIEVILNQIKECVRNGKYSISLNNNRQENIDFINEYNLRAERQEEIMLNIDVKDFCYSLTNTNPNFPSNLLYIFAPSVDLNDAFGSVITISVYTKFNVLNRADGDYTIVISLHELNRPIDYLFR